MRTLTLRQSAPAALLAVSALFLAGCGDESNGDDDTPDASSCTEFKSGAASDGIEVSGDFGKTQEVTFDKPLKAPAEIQRTVVDEGDGDVTAEGDKVDTRITAFNGADGKAIGSQPLPLTVGDDDTLGAFAAGIDCVNIGSRVVVVVEATDVYGEQPPTGMKGTDALIIVTDVIGEQKPLTPEPWTTGVPKVTFKDGKPKLTLTGKQPTELLLKVLKQGEGDEVKAGDQVTVDYQGTNWRTKKIFDQSYGKQPATFATDQVVQGFGAALVGQKVGTRLIVSIPAEYGYGAAGNPQAGIKGTDVIVFVLEIKATVKPTS